MKVIGVLLFICCYGVSYGQTKTISGVVKNATDNAPLAGVTVSVIKAPATATTDDNGEFKINATIGDTLLFTFIGKNEHKEVVGEKSILNILMYDATSGMEEVTVVAFGKQKKASVVGAITTVNTKDLRVPASNLTSAFAGRIPGLISYQNTGEPGADNAQFFVRGVTTFGYQAAPLILIDGFESSTDNLARLLPDDIESFSIMKDALATSLYGARGANGIIIVNTKTGKEGKIAVNARIDVNVATPTRKVKMLDGVQYMRLYNEARVSRDPALGTFYSEQKIQSTANGENPMIYPNIDWQKELFKNSTTNTKANINLGGGGQVATYYVSFGMDKETGLLKVDPRNNFNNNIDISRWLIRSNVIFKLTPTTKLDTRIQGRFEGYKGPFISASDLFRNVMNSNPVDFPAYYEPDSANLFTEHILFGSTFVNGGLKVNPYAQMVRGYDERNESTITAQATLMQDLDFIVKGLKFQGKASATTWNKYTGTRSYFPYLYELDSYNQVTRAHTLFPLNPTTGQAYLGDVNPSRDGDALYYFEARFNWDKIIGKHNISLMTVGMWQNKLLTAGNSTSIYETLPERNMGNSGRANYTYDNRYFLEFAYAYNGSEKFTGAQRFGFFPSVGGGWMVSNEDFWEPYKDVISTLKLRGSWGLVGNDAIAGRSGRFFYLSDVAYSTNIFNDGYRWGESFMNAYPGFLIRRYANPNITWEQSEKWNAGLELNLFKESLKTTIDFFKDNRRNIYMPRQNFPATAGLEAAISGNVGEVASKGIDASIDYTKSITADWYINLRANFTYATNKLVKIDEKDYPDKYLKRLGSNINQQWGLVAERLFVDDYEMKNSPVQDFGRYMAGDIKYKDINGDGVINDNDRVALGFPTVPEIQYGFGATIVYKTVDFNFFFNGNARTSFFIDATAESRGGGDPRDGIAPFANRRNALAIIGDDYWSETNPNVHAFWPRLSADPLENNMQQSSWWLRDGSFLKLRSVELGYTPNLSRWKIKSGSRFYVSTENPLIFSSFKLWDPEMGSRGLGYPPNRRFNIGFQLSL
ncbi:SusC/RagA family TonB-linked outer membrane protein [Niabella beijingensis]|uniref:SusC/RagA family TonB-linked outer membrane protein n=1 Tax=Niabella beijingensis TaxID=2872700 RepID=UPI001CBB51F8|nr:TonB-dependent receptor [Niabella beijingensis]MBZ4187351.1 TonB-dependent receptor [Niabella beijingensis]